MDAGEKEAFDIFLNLNIFYSYGDVSVTHSKVTVTPLIISHSPVATWCGHVGRGGAMGPISRTTVVDRIRVWQDPIEIV